jgi:hypothetical protein
VYVRQQQQSKQRRMAARKTLLQSKSVSNLSPIRQHGLEVDIKSFEEMDNGSYVNFVVEITKEGITWEVRKRYSEFKFFQQALAEHTQHLSSEFPSKTVRCPHLDPSHSVP